MRAISLFSCGGIGDLAVRDQGIEVLVANELSNERAEVFRYNFSAVEMIVGDIWEEKENIIQTTLKKLENKPLDMVFATPPCQGMSKNSGGKLLNLVRKGKRPNVDLRNRLVMPAIDIFLELGATTLIIHTLDKYKYMWKRSDGKKVSDKLIRELIGESIPPYGLSVLFKYLVKIQSGKVTINSDVVKDQLCLV